jgi:carboxypeptidase Taq
MNEDPRLNQLKERLAEVDDLRKAATLLFWDQRVMMPPGGSAARAEAIATISRLAQEHFIADEIGRLLEELRGLEESSDFESVEASLVRVTRHDYEKAVRVPPELVGEMRRAATLALSAWGPAKEQSNFELLRPHLETNLELRHRYIDCFDPADEQYDVLLDDYEPNMKTAEVREIFDVLKQELRPLVQEIAEAEVDDSFLTGDFDPLVQRDLGLEIVRRFGYTDEEWRLDQTPHPFMSSPGVGDIRLTTNFRPDDLSSLFATMHEFGHGVYEWGVDASLARTPLGSGVSLGLHESQSRTWENLVGRSRSFWRFFFPRLQAAFPKQLGSVDEEAFYRAVNKVHPSLIRIDADEITYNMHIILRFELEQELIDDRLAIKDLPAAWNERMDEYLGVDVPDDSRGVLQDMHWAGGSIGYFPTYSLGNVISVQIWERAKEDLGDLEERFEQGEFGELREWLRTHLYVLGRKFTPQETIERVTGSRIDAQPYVRYLREKLAPQVA